MGPNAAPWSQPFNGGFKLDTGARGVSCPRASRGPLRAGLGSIVTYANGYTDIGSWHEQVPAPGRVVVSARQNLTS